MTNWRRRLKQALYWAIAIAVLLHLGAMVFLDQSFLPGPLP